MSSTSDLVRSLIAQARELSVQEKYQAAIEMLTPVAFNDENPAAQIELALLYAIPRNPQKDFHKSYHLFERAANHGSDHAKWNLATATERGEGVPPNPQKALQMHLKLADSGYVASQIRAGQMFVSGLGTDRNITLGIKYLQMAADRDSVQGIAELARILYQHGQHAESIPYFERLASKGYCGAQYQLGELWGNGLGVEHDHEKSRHYFRMAEEQGHSEASYSLGYIYQVGYHVEKNIDQALHHLVRASELGHPVAQMEAGELYHTRGDFASARKYLSMSPLPAAQLRLARMHVLGQGGAKDLDLARSILKPLANKVLEAQEYLTAIDKEE